MKPCVPDMLPLSALDWRALLPLIGRANAAVARYDGMLQTLPNPAVLLSPITANEAVLSSKIEGTQATLDEVLGFEAGIIPSAARLGDLEEIANYRAAVRLAEASLVDRPLSLSLIKGIHQRLLQGVRGLDKEPGRFRLDQNWIGRPKARIDQARFVPPDPAVLPSFLENWEAYLRNADDDPMMLVAIAHAQFEILHPFKDGNGRIGRMLIPLILHQRGALSRPMFYISEHLEANRSEYYDALLGITSGGGWNHWLEFFLNAIVAQAEANLEKTRLVRELYEQMRRRFVETTHSQYAMAAVDVFFMRPTISGPEFGEMARFNNRITANNMLRQLESAVLIQKLRPSSGARPAIYAMTSLIDIIDGASARDLKNSRSNNPV